MNKRTPEYGLEFLRAFDGRIHHLEEGYWIKFEIERVKATKERPHGLSYSFTLHGPYGTRLVGFDNAHGVHSPRCPVQTKTTGERSLAPNGDRSRTAVPVQGR